MDMVIGAWAVFQVIFPFLVLGLLISIHLRLKDVEKLQSETFRQLMKRDREHKQSA